MNSIGGNKNLIMTSNIRNFGDSKDLQVNISLIIYDAFIVENKQYIFFSVVVINLKHAGIWFNESYMNRLPYNL